MKLVKFTLSSDEEVWVNPYRIETIVKGTRYDYRENPDYDKTKFSWNQKGIQPTIKEEIHSTVLTFGPEDELWVTESLSSVINLLEDI